MGRPGSVEPQQQYGAHVRARQSVVRLCDIESWYPDGTLYAGTPSDDCPWCQSWCDAHAGYCPNPAISCAHSHSLNCLLKGRAFWWLGGWRGGMEKEEWG
jgi:hypothetical protein